MVNIVIVEKNGDLKSTNHLPEKDELYKKCKFKKGDGFELRTTWKVKKDKYNFNFVSMYARDSGKANTENKYDLPPPVDTVLYFGCIALVAHKGADVDDLIDLGLDDWTAVYEELFGGFENLADTAKEDDNEVDELEHIAAELKTKSGYLKDGFVVDDNAEDDLEGNSKSGEDESSWEDAISELDYDQYSYSDED